jgi:large subunit ribosomal protein L24
MLIKKNDLVKVISGDDKGKEGRVIETQAKKGRVLVEGVNIHKRHMRKIQMVALWKENFQLHIQM